MQQFFFGCSYCGLGVLYQLKITNYPLSLQPKNGNNKKNILCKRGFQHKECFKSRWNNFSKDYKCWEIKINILIVFNAITCESLWYKH